MCALFWFLRTLLFSQNKGHVLISFWINGTLPVFLVWEMGLVWVCLWLENFIVFALKKRTWCICMWLRTLPFSLDICDVFFCNSLLTLSFFWQRHELCGWELYRFRFGHTCMPNMLMSLKTSPFSLRYIWHICVGVLAWELYCFLDKDTNKSPRRLYRFLARVWHNKKWF